MDYLNYNLAKNRQSEIRKEIEKERIVEVFKENQNGPSGSRPRYIRRSFKLAFMTIGKWLVR